MKAPLFPRLPSFLKYASESALPELREDGLRLDALYRGIDYNPWMF